MKFSYFPALPTINTYSMEACGLSLAMTNEQLQNANRAWQIADEAVLVPFALGDVINITYLWLDNGATISGNFDIGVYTNEGGASPVLVRLVSTGSTAQAGAGAIQAVDVTDTIIGPGTFYLALVLDNTTGEVTGQALSTYTEAYGIRNAPSCFPLPATITSFTEPGDQSIYFWGLMQGRTVI